MSLISAENIHKNYQVGEVSVQALKGLSFEIEPASFVSFVGPSGSGKTTLLNLIGCLDKPSDGKLTVADTDVLHLDRKQSASFRGSNIGFIFQDFNLLPVLTVYENIEYPLLMVQNVPASERKKRVNTVIEAVGMTNQKDKYPDQISGGQKQRVAVARALVTNPKLVLADEPTANLDHKTAYMVIELMKKMRDEFKTTFIFSTHDQKIVGEVEILYTLEDGELTSRQVKGAKEMGNLFKIAIRNLLRYKRRTLLTASLITVGVVFVLVFISVSGSLKNMMIAQTTDSMLGHLQVHRKGYVASIENLPLNLNLKAGDITRLENILDKQPEIEAYSPRIKFGGMFSTFVETTNIRLNGVHPDREFKTAPLLAARVIEGSKSLEKGEIWIPELLAKGMKVKVGDIIVIIATNQDGSVNGKQFKVSGVLESATGPGGRDGYIHIDDAMEVLRMDAKEISEFAIRLKDFGKLQPFSEKLDGLLAKELNQQNKPIFEVHTWETLSPFYNIARMIDVMTFFIKLMLIAIVLISIMNVMIMAVYERIREIGTIAAIGTLPSRILNMFVIEGFCLGIVGAVIGNIAGIIIIFILNLSKITFNFGMQKGIILQANINPYDIMVISATVIIVSVLASLQPAFKASRMEPIKALRHV